MARGLNAVKLVAGKMPLQMCCACLVDITTMGLPATVLLDLCVCTCSGATQVPYSMKTIWRLMTQQFQDSTARASRVQPAALTVCLGAECARPGATCLRDAVEFCMHAL